MDTREDNSGKTAYPYLERVKAFAEEVYQEEMAELKRKIRTARRRTRQHSMSGIASGHR